MVLSENKKTSVQKPRILLRLDENKRFKPSRLIFNWENPILYFQADYGFSIKTFAGSKPMVKNTANIVTFLYFFIFINNFFVNNRISDEYSILQRRP